MFYVKGSSIYTLIHTNLVYFLPSAESELHPPWFHLASFDAIFNLVLCMPFAIMRSAGLAVVLLWSRVSGYQHNSRLNMLEHIPSNPEHTVIRGDWASYYCDSTKTCHWSAELCKGVCVWEGWGAEWKRKQRSWWPGESKYFFGGRQQTYRKAESVWK